MLLGTGDSGGKLRPLGLGSLLAPRAVTNEVTV
jgi:hypothetical protein